MSSTSVVYDVVVIGGGISGLITAVRAVQLNLCVVVLEQSIDEEYMCNSRLTSGVFHCALNTPSDSVQNLFSKIKKDTNEFASEELAELISQNALSVIRWLQTLGVRFIKGAQSYYEFILSPPTLHHQKEGWRNKGGDNLLKRLEGHLLKAGSCIKRGHRTISIKAREGNQFEVFCQVSVGKEISIKTKNVVIADGGFQNNIKLINESITPSPDKIFQRNGRSAYGDGILLSRSLGGDVTGLDGFYGHLLSIDCFVNDALWPNPWLDAIASSGILVTKEGTRFADEGNGGIFLANQVAKLEDPMSCFAIADEKIWTDRGNLTMQGPNPKLIELGGTYFVGATIQELAVRANINESNLSKTVFQYNNSIDKNEVHLLTPIRTKNKGPYFPIMRPPYYAFPVCAGITYTMGGIKTNQFMQVISVTDEPIRGLFAVGACTGGLEGGANIGYVGGLIKSSVMGFKAADFIAQNTHKNNL